MYIIFDAYYSVNTILYIIFYASYSLHNICNFPYFKTHYYQPTDLPTNIVKYRATIIAKKHGCK